MYPSYYCLISRQITKLGYPLENSTLLTEPLRITDSGKYDLADYTANKEIVVSGAMLLGTSIEVDLTTTIKIIHRKTDREFDRFMLKAFTNPTRPDEDRISIKGKFFNPKEHYLKVETKNSSDAIHFLLYFSGK